MAFFAPNMFFWFKASRPVKIFFKIASMSAKSLMSNGTFKFILKAVAERPLVTAQAVHGAARRAAASVVSALLALCCGSAS